MLKDRRSTRSTRRIARAAQSRRSAKEEDNYNDAVACPDELPQVVAREIRVVAEKQIMLHITVSSSGCVIKEGRH